MIPGMNPRAMKQAMKKMGIQQEDLHATEVIIRTPDKELIIANPQVARINMMGQKTYQVVGEAEERPLSRGSTGEEAGDSKEPEINEEDIKTVVEQTGVDENKAIETIKKHQGDLAAAIMELKP
ncbi:nascent polypeptide-associated complex protein [Candidatus Woesearchaeota archaeon]|nr:nascent polypeptide-associated complex protein [Candidatus Woesearchaeota archaeon]